MKEVDVNLEKKGNALSTVRIRGENVCALTRCGVRFSPLLSSQGKTTHVCISNTKHELQKSVLRMCGTHCGLFALEWKALRLRLC